MRFVRGFRTLAGLLAVVFIMATVTMFIIFPRLANQIAGLLGTGAENPIHWVPAIIFDILILILAYFWVWRPWRTFTYAQEAQGLVVEKGQGRAFIDTESVRQQVYAAVIKVNNVQHSEVAIENELGRAVVRANILTDNDINGPRKKQEINREIKKVVQDQFGVRLAGDPIINISLTPLEGVPAGPAVEPLPIRRAAAPVSPVTALPAPIVAEPAILPKAAPEPLRSGVNTSEPAPFKRRAFIPESSASTAPAIPPAPPIHPPEPVPEPNPEPAAEIPTTFAAEPLPPVTEEDAELAALMAQLSQTSPVEDAAGMSSIVTPLASSFDTLTSTEPATEPATAITPAADPVTNPDSGSSETDSTADNNDLSSGQPFVRRRFVPPTANAGSDGKSESS